MDRERFDGLARLLATRGSRRGTLGALLGVALLGQDPDALAKRGKHHRKTKARGDGEDHDGEGVQGEGRPGAAHKKHHRKHGTQRKRRKQRRQQNRDRDEGSGDCPPEVCQDAFRDPFGFCVYTESPDNQPGPGCTAPGRLCCQGTCCPAGNTCVNGVCVCNAASCPNGCCSDGPGHPGTCLPGNTNQDCGSGGAICGGCASETVCVGGRCVCNAQSCPFRCCSNGPGHPGTCQPTSDATCGRNGEQCVACPAGNICFSGTCICDALSCPNGCCSNGPDHPGTCHPNSATACGHFGAQCVGCPAGNACVNGLCVCNAASCSNGCCTFGPGNPGTCEPLTRETCGINGAQCVSCCHPPPPGSCDICNTSTGQCN